MRIIHCINSLKPETGGPASFIRELASMQEKLDFVHHAVCIDAENAPWLSSYPSTKFALGPGLLGKYALSSDYVNWIDRHAEEYSGMIISGIWNFASLGAWLGLKRRKSKLPYVVFIHGMLDPWFQKTYPLKAIKKNIYWTLAESHVLREARAVLFTCQEEMILAQSSFLPYKLNPAVIPYGVLPYSGNIEEAKESFLSMYPVVRQHPTLLFLGRIAEKKGVDILLRAFCRLAKQNDSLLVVAGPAEDTYLQRCLRVLDEFDASVRERVIWTGMLAGASKWGALQACEALVMPSHQENFARVVAEGLSCGKPALLSQRVNIWRDLEKKQAGLFSLDTEADTMNMLDQWMRMSVKEKELLSHNAYELFLELFDWRKNAACLIDLMKTLQT